MKTIGIVAEGPRDYELIAAVIDTITNEENSYQMIQPEPDMAGRFGNGWKGVWKWCETNQGSLNTYMNSLTPVLDFLVIHVKDLPATGEHQWDEGVVTKEPTATKTGIKTFTCTVCSATKTEDIVKVHTHDYTRLGEIVKESSCETEGERWVYCNYEGCNERVLKPMAAIGSHDWDFANAECLKKATCTEQGTMLMHCKRDASHTTTYSYGGTGHVWDEGTITTQPTYDEYGVRTLHCKNCDATTTEKVFPTKYTFTVTVVPPTCTEDGYTMHKCKEDDSLSYKDNIVHSTGHHAAIRVIEPTCKEEGAPKSTAPSAMK